MANENVTRVTADASGYTAELSKAAKSAQAFAESNEAASRRIAAAQEAVAEATANGSTASARSINSFMSSLTRQADAAGKTRAELLRMQAAQLGVSQAAEASIAKIEAAAAATAKAGGAAHEFSLDSASARRELLVLAHELSQGNIKNFAGSMLVLAERTDAMSLIFNKTALTGGAFIALLAGSVEVTVRAAEALAEYGESIERISKVTGQTTDSIQAFGFAAGVFGVNTKDASAALAALGKAQNEALHGNNDAVAAFKALGISMEMLKTSAPDQVLLRVADAFAGAQDGAGKAAVATELFGSAGADLIPLLDGGSKKLNDLTNSAETAGAVLGTDTVAQLAAFKEQMALSQEKMSAMNLSAKTELLPTILNITSALSDNASLKPILIDFYDGVATTVKYAAVAISAAVTAAEQFATALNTTQSIANRAGALDFSGATQAFEKGKKEWEADQKAYESFVNRVLSPTAPALPHTPEPTHQINYATGQNSSKKDENALDAQMQSLKDAMDAREKLVASTVEHIKSLQQQGVIDALTAIKQEHDARDAAYADELKLADQEIVLAKHKKQEKVLVEWKDKKAAIQAAITKNDQDAKDATALLQAKEVAAAKAYSAALNVALQARADAISAQLQGKTLGATDADDLARAAAAAKEYADKYAALVKSLDENKISTSQFNDEITALQNYERARLELESDATDKIKALNADGFAGAQKAAADYAEEASNRFKEVGSAVTDVARGMEDAWANFVTTGKLNFKSLATSVVADIARMQARAAISGLFNFAIGAVAAYFAPGSGSASTLTGVSSTLDTDVASAAGSSYTGGGNTFGFYADGGAVSGPGTGTSDSIHAMLSNGEFVVNARAAAQHRSLLESINNGARINGLAKFASGGFVGSPAMAAVSGRSGDTNVQVDVSASGGGLDQSDAPWLKNQIQALVDTRIAQKMKGQGGYAWQQKYGSIR